MCFKNALAPAVIELNKMNDELQVENERLLKIVRHQKYKRCLTMAEWCDQVMMSCELRGYTVHRVWANEHEWAMRWKYRWLDIAKKFKEK